MSNSPMVEQVNRMVGNLLMWSGEVALPGVGSLYVERQAAKRLSKRNVLPPCRVVSFSSQMRGVSLVDEIARAAQCDMTQAQDIYDRWLSRTQEGDTLKIEGVGGLKFKNFDLDPEFDRLLNPQGHEPVRLKPARRFDWVLWFGVTVIVLVVAAGTALWMTEGSLLNNLYGWGSEEAVAVAETAHGTTSSSDFAVIGDTTQDSAETVSSSAFEQPVQSASEQDPQSRAEVSHSVAQQVPSLQTSAASQISDSQSLASKPASVKQVTTRPAASGTPEAPANFTSGYRYVVLGVFSAAENAARAVRDAVAKDADIQCSVYRFGAKLLVSPFNAADTEACRLFIRDKEDRFPEMWTYTAK